MKNLKVVGIVIAVLVALFLGVAAVLPSTAVVVRSIEINASPEKIQSVLNDYDAFREWNPWSSQEPGAEVVITEAIDGEPASYAWKGDKIGVGRLTQIQSSSSYIEERLDFEAPMKSTAKSYYKMEPGASPGATKVTWGYEGESAYPVGRYFGLMMDSMMGADYEKGLSNLKNRIESEGASGSEPEESTVEIDPSTAPTEEAH